MIRGGKNSEGFHDPTATVAIGNVMREEKRRKMRNAGGIRRSAQQAKSDKQENTGGRGAQRRSLVGQRKRSTSLMRGGYEDE